MFVANVLVPSPLFSNAVFANARDGWVSNSDALRSRRTAVSNAL